MNLWVSYLSCDKTFSKELLHQILLDHTGGKMGAPLSVAGDESTDSGRPLCNAPSDAKPVAIAITQGTVHSLAMVLVHRALVPAHARVALHGMTLRGFCVGRGFVRKPSDLLSCSIIGRFGRICRRCRRRIALVLPELGRMRRSKCVVLLPK